METAFYISGGIAIVATVMVVTRLNAVHALLYLVVSLLAVAVTFYTLGAPFVAGLEVIVYAGAIMVLFVFTVMLLNLGEAAVETERGWLGRGAWIVPGLLILVLLAEFVVLFAGGGRMPALSPPGAQGGQIGPKEVGRSLFTTYLLGVELASMLLLAGLVAAYHIGRRLLRRGGAGKEEGRIRAGEEESGALQG